MLKLAVQEIQGDAENWNNNDSLIDINNNGTCKRWE